MRLLTTERAENRVTPNIVTTPNFGLPAGHSLYRQIRYRRDMYAGQAPGNGNAFSDGLRSDFSVSNATTAHSNGRCRLFATHHQNQIHDQAF